MARMLDRVLLIGQVEAQMLEFNPRPVDLLSVCQAIVEETRALQPEAHCSLVTRFSPCHPAGLFDAKLLRHILGKPALQRHQVLPAATVWRLSASPAVTATRSSRLKTRAWAFPPTRWSHLFEPFHRASNVADIQGTGLGLAIVKKSVELHGGTIEVSSEPGIRTCFTITL